MMYFIFRIRKPYERLKYEIVLKKKKRKGQYFCLLLGVVGFGSDSIKNPDPDPRTKIIRIRRQEKIGALQDP